MPTTRLAIPTYADTAVAAFSSQLNAVSEQIDLKTVPLVEVSFMEERPPPGTPGRIAHVRNPNTWWVDNGVAWKALPSSAGKLYETGLAAAPMGVQREESSSHIFHCTLSVWGYYPAIVVKVDGAKVGECIQQSGATLTGGVVPFMLGPGSRWEWRNESGYYCETQFSRMTF